MVALAGAGVAALAGWMVLARRLDEPIIDLRALTRPILLTLLAVVMPPIRESLRRLEARSD